MKEYKNVFNTFANNWRFCMREKIKNAGTQILKELRRQAPLYWKQKYNDNLNYLITFVAGGNNGAVCSGLNGRRKAARCRFLCNIVFSCLQFSLFSPC